MNHPWFMYLRRGVMEGGWAGGADGPTLWRGCGRTAGAVVRPYFLRH